MTANPARATDESLLDDGVVTQVSQVLEDALLVATVVLGPDGVSDPVRIQFFEHLAGADGREDTFGVRVFGSRWLRPDGGQQQAEESRDQGRGE